MKDQTVSAASGLPFEAWLGRSAACLLFVPLFLPPLHGVLRAVFRPWVVHHVREGMARLEQLQRLRSPLLLRVCSWACLTVSVEFYVTFLPILIWAVNPQLGWRLVFLLAFALYVGNAMKDVVSAPRPAGITTAKGEAVLLAVPQTSELTTSSQEYGLPSSHTLNSCVLNFYMIYFSLEQGLISERTGHALYIVASVWIAFIAFARLLLYMHTPIDLLGGMLGGVAVLNFYITTDDAFEAFIIQSGPAIAIPCMLLACVLLLRAHPKPLRHTPSYEYSVAFAGVAFGIAAGLSRAHGTLEYAASAQLLTRLWRHGSVMGIARRLGLGFFLVAANQAVAKSVMLWLIPPFYRLYPVRLRRLWQPPMHSLQEDSEWTQQGIPVNKSGRPWDVDITARFAAYASIGWTVIEFAPRVFAALAW